MILAGISFYNALAPWIAMSAGFVGVVWLTRRSMAGDAITFLRSTLGVLHNENKELKRERAEHLAELESLRSKTDFQSAMSQVVEIHLTHEKLSVDRFDKIMAILGLIAMQLGAEQGDIDAASSR